MIHCKVQALGLKRLYDADLLFTLTKDQFKLLQNRPVPAIRSITSICSKIS